MTNSNSDLSPVSIAVIRYDGSAVVDLFVNPKRLISNVKMQISGLTGIPIAAQVLRLKDGPVLEDSSSLQDLSIDSCATVVLERRAPMLAGNLTIDDLRLLLANHVELEEALDAYTDALHDAIFDLDLIVGAVSKTLLGRAFLQEDVKEDSFKKQRKSTSIGSFASSIMAPRVMAWALRGTQAVLRAQTKAAHSSPTCASTLSVPHGNKKAQFLIELREALEEVRCQYDRENEELPVQSVERSVSVSSCKCVVQGNIASIDTNSLAQPVSDDADMVHKACMDSADNKHVQTGVAQVSQMQPLVSTGHANVAGKLAVLPQATLEPDDTLSTERREPWQGAGRELRDRLSRRYSLNGEVVYFGNADVGSATDTAAAVST
eukprot:TRINITY_DN22223_c0_g1_i1.p1 TRINITY_DN22223_c0_g1~~TRINITY_DN22223_c0_g1_i1.p1  ORF type:complete len:377 (-),score=32.30 TRINITY_DN22223_c0_g1_i1:247-1377(-)